MYLEKINGPEDVKKIKIDIIFCPPVCPRSIHLSLSHSRI